jgi:hypothetical protein
MSMTDPDAQAADALDQLVLDIENETSPDSDTLKEMILELSRIVGGLDNGHNDDFDAMDQRLLALEQVLEKANAAMQSAQVQAYIQLLAVAAQFAQAVAGNTGDWSQLQQDGAQLAAAIHQALSA